MSFHRPFPSEPDEPEIPEEERFVEDFDHPLFRPLNPDGTVPDHDDESENK